MADWTITSSARLRGRMVSAGMELSIRGERGRFRFVKHVRNDRTGKEWIDVYGGAKGHETIRSFRPERVRVVHRANTMRAQSAKAVALAAVAA